MQDLFRGTALNDSAGFTTCDMEPVYFSLNPYHEAFKEQLNIQQYTLYENQMGGMIFNIADN